MLSNCVGSFDRFNLTGSGMLSYAEFERMVLTQAQKTCMCETMYTEYVMISSASHVFSPEPPSLLCRPSKEQGFKMFGDVFTVA